LIAERSPEIDRDLLWETISQKGLPVFTSEQYRAKAAEYAELAKTARDPEEVREFQRLERSFVTLADNKQWVVDNHDQTLHAMEHIEQAT
jgi:hypothetical protein